MIPFPLYFGVLDPNLGDGFLEFRLQDAIYANYGGDSTLWTSDQIAELGRDVQEAYRWILYPETIPGERVPHTWTFLEQTTTLITTVDTYNYTLPADFGSIIGKQMWWPSNSGYNNVCLKSDEQILNKRQWSSQTGRPCEFAIRWLPQNAGSQQRRELIFWPTPDAEYTLTYKYAVLTGALSESNPYPLGGPRIAQLMIEACKAIGETKKNGARGDQWNLFLSRLHSAIMLDKGTNSPSSLGVMGDGDSGYYPDYQRRANYYFGPDVAYGASLYQLEA